MSFLTRAFARVPAAPTEERSLVSISSPDILTMFGAGPTVAGVSVSETSVLGLATVWRCASIIAGGIAGLPLRTIRQAGDISERVPSFLDKPAGDLTRFELIETTVLHLLLWGNAYLAHIYGGAGQILGLSPIHPSAVGIEVADNGAKSYVVALANGQRQTFSDRTLTHIKGMSTDGIRGLSPLTLARNGAFGTALAADKTAAKMFGNGMLASAIATVEEQLEEDEAAAIKTGLDRKLSGVDNAGQIAFINRNIKIHPWQINPVDAQWLESRNYQKGELATIFGVPDTLVGLGEKQSSWGTGIREMHQAMARWTFMSWTSRIEDRLTILLNTPAETGRKAEFDYKALLAPDPKTVIESLVLQCGAPYRTVNEVRKIDNLPPIDGGDVLRAPQPAAAPKQEVTE